MKTHIVRIGNSRGVRIPKPLLEQTGLNGQVEISVREDSLVISPVKKKPREGWEESFSQMAARGDDALLDEGTPLANRFDEDEWEWQ